MKQEWFGNIRKDIFAGLVSAFAIIPEVIGFCIVAGISPMMGLYASIFLTVVLAFLGGRPAMISAAAGSMALVIVSLVRDHGADYLIAATILTGIFMILAGLMRVGSLIKLIPNSVNIGFVNALAILIFVAQLEHFNGEGLPMYLLVALGLVIIYVLPRFFTAVPSTLVAVVVVTGVSMILGSPVKTIGDMGEILAQLPIFALPNVPLSLETLWIILPYSISLTLVGLVETLLTLQVVDELTDTKGDSNRESCGLGLANILSGFFGGTCGCAMIGQAIACVEAGGRGRLANFVSGSFLLMLIFVLNDILVQIPLAALVAVMFSVSFTTFDWMSVRNLLRLPKTDAFVIVLVVVVVVLTNNLAIGVVLGVALTAVFFAVKMSSLKISAEYKEEEATLTYDIFGEIFFASSRELESHLLDVPLNVPKNTTEVILGFSHARVWDESGATAIKKTVVKLRREGFKVRVTGLDHNSRSILEKIYL